MMNPSLMWRESNERWIKYYSSSHNILLVGEGDFSFSLCLAMSFGCAANIVATTMDSYDRLIDKYKNARSNLVILKILGARVLYGVDATHMSALHELRCKKFHRIIYNFPHAGFFGRESDPDMMMMHRDLVRRFLKNAGTLLSLDGEVHVSHKATAPFDSWGIEDLGSDGSLICIAQDEFRIGDYPGYNNKRGSGNRADEPFPLGACKTYRFRLHPKLRMRKIDSIPPTPQMFPPPPTPPQIFPQPPPPPPPRQMFPPPPPPPPPRQMFPPPPPPRQMFPPPPPPPPPPPQMFPPHPPQMFRSHGIGVQQQAPTTTFTSQMFPPPPPPPPPPPRYDDGVALQNNASECHRVFGRYLNHVEETFGDTSYDVRSSVKEALWHGYEMYMNNAAPGTPLSGFTNVLEELYQLSIVRSERLRQMLFSDDHLRYR